MALGALIPILNLLEMDAGATVVVTTDAGWPRPRLMPPVPGAPWVHAMPRPRRSAGLEQSVPTPAARGFLFDENPKTFERVMRGYRQMAQVLNSLIRKGRLTIDFIDFDSDIVLDSTQVEDALGYTPADADTEIVTGNGVQGGGTLGNPTPIVTDDTVVKQVSIGAGQWVVLLKDGVAPTATPSGGVYLYSIAGTLKVKDGTGTEITPS